MPRAVALQQSPAGTFLPAIQVVPDMVNVQTGTATAEWADPSIPHVPAWRQNLTHPAWPLLGGLWSSGWWKREHSKCHFHCWEASGTIGLALYPFCTFLLQSLLGLLSPGVNFPLQLAKAGPAREKELVWKNVST